jgi:hypothetical protein
MEAGDALPLKQEIESLRKADDGHPLLPVALVGSEAKEMYSFDIFTVLCDLHLARPADQSDGEPQAYVKSKSKGERDAGQKDKRKPPNQIKDKESGKVYVMKNRPSVIISITGDAQDLPDDDELTRGVDDLMSFCPNEQGFEEWAKLSREAASRAILSNFMLSQDAIDEKLKAFAESSNDRLKRTDGMKCLQISFLLQERIKALNELFKEKKEENENFQKNFEYPSVRDMMLNVEKPIDQQFKSLKDDFDFLKKKNTNKKGTSGEFSNSNSKVEPVASGKRLSKAR